MGRMMACGHPQRKFSGIIGGSWDTRPNLRRSLCATLEAATRTAEGDVGGIMSDFVITYFKEGSHLSSSPWNGDLDAAKKVARDGLVSRGADELQIRSDTLDGALVWQDRRDP